MAKKFTKRRKNSVIQIKIIDFIIMGAHVVQWIL